MEHTEVAVKVNAKAEQKHKRPKEENKKGTKNIILHFTVYVCWIAGEGNGDNSRLDGVNVYVLSRDSCSTFLMIVELHISGFDGI